MNYNEAEHYIHSLTRFGSQLGLDRMKKLLEFLGNPQKKLKFIHIAGTNGKGSTAKMSSNILIDAGYKVGMYISPFVIEFRERFQINGKMISKTELVEIITLVKEKINEMSKSGVNVTEFEAVTAIGMVFFARHDCDIVALEVGLGGRFDATNVIDTPEVAIITSISMDHTDILGDTISKIAFEKAGIIKENTDIVTYPLQEIDAIAVFMEKCQQTNSRFILPNKNAVKILSSTVLGSEFLYGDKKYKIKLAGTHQIYNAVAVIEAMNILRKKGFKMEDEAIYRGLKNAVFPARFEIMSRIPLIIVDGAHNKQAAESLAETLKKLEVPKKIAIVGMMADKDYESALKAISESCNTIITVPVPVNPRAIDPLKLAEVAKKYCRSVTTINDYKDALAEAVALKGEDGAVIICGSFYMASDMRKVVKEYLKEKVKFL